MTTNRDITKAIEAKTGYKNIKVHKGGGMCRFYVDSDDEQGLDLSLTDGEMVFALSQLSADEWANSFANALKATPEASK